MLVPSAETDFRRETYHLHLHFTNQIYPTNRISNINGYKWAVSTITPDRERRLSLPSPTPKRRASRHCSLLHDVNVGNKPQNKVLVTVVVRMNAAAVALVYLVQSMMKLQKIDGLMKVLLQYSEFIVRMSVMKPRPRSTSRFIILMCRMLGGRTISITFTTTNHHHPHHHLNGHHHRHYHHYHHGHRHGQHYHHHHHQQQQQQQQQQQVFLCTSVAHSRGYCAHAIALQAHGGIQSVHAQLQRCSALFMEAAGPYRVLLHSMPVTCTRWDQFARVSSPTVSHCCCLCCCCCCLAPPPHTQLSPPP